MTMAMEGVRTRQVAVTADHKLMWELTDMPSRHGMLLVSPGCPNEVVDTMLGLDDASGVSGDFDFVGRGSLGAVYSHGEVAYKIHDSDKLNNMYPASELLANIALSEGVKLLHDSPDTPPFSHLNQPVRVSTPQYFAGLIPEHPFRRSGTPSSFIIAMSLEYGADALEGEIPNKQQRSAYYREAVNRTRMDPEIVMYDDVSHDGSPRNILISATPGIPGITMTKLDVMAGADFAMRDFGIC